MPFWRKKKSKQQKDSKQEKFESECEPSRVVSETNYAEVLRKIADQALHD